LEQKSEVLKDMDNESLIWKNLGSVREGRGHLGEEMPVLFYRLMQHTMLDVLSRDRGIEQANCYFRQAGYLAGVEFARNTLNLEVDFYSFIFDLQQLLEQLKFGILKLEGFTPKNGDIILTVGQSLDASGLPVTYEYVCVYTEGFLAGILEAHTGKKYDVHEVDCRVNGDNLCRFCGSVSEK